MAFTDDEVRAMYEGLPKEELEWALEMNRETNRGLAAMDEAMQEIQDIRQVTAEMIADDYAEEAKEIQEDLDELARQQEADRRKEEQNKKINVLPWKKNK